MRQNGAGAHFCWQFIGSPSSSCGDKKKVDNGVPKHAGGAACVDHCHADAAKLRDTIHKTHSRTDICRDKCIYRRYYKNSTHRQVHNTRQLLAQSLIMPHATITLTNETNALRYCTIIRNFIYFVLLLNWSCALLTRQSSTLQKKIFIRARSKNISQMALQVPTDGPWAQVSFTLVFYEIIRNRMTFQNSETLYQ